MDYRKNRIFDYMALLSAVKTLSPEHVLSLMSARARVLARAHTHTHTHTPLCIY